MSHGLAYFALTAYWLFFFKHVIAHPYSICASEALTYDFPNMVHSGRYWRKGKLPEDPYHWKDYLGVVIGQLYPVNILFAWLSSFISLDRAWYLYVINLLGHHLVMSLVAYHLFGGGLVGLFGALAWSYAGFHIKQSFFYVHSFFWITVTLATGSPWALGMLYLAGHPRIFIYFTYLTAIFYWKIIPLAVLIASYQLYRYWKYSKKSVTTNRTYESKTVVGKVPWWWYITMALPVRHEGYVGGVGYQEVNFYVTPLVCLFALFAIPNNLLLTGGIVLCITLSRGGILFKRLNKLMMRFPQRWGYFAMLGVVMLSVNGITLVHMNQNQKIFVVMLTGVLLLKNSSMLPLYPFGQWAKKPSYYYDTLLLRCLSGKGIVNNLPYPVYRGYLNKIYTVGYTGGNYLSELADKLNLPYDGVAPYNWFDYKEDGPELDKFGIKYHIGKRPSKNPKWVHSKCFKNLWINTGI